MLPVLLEQYQQAQQNKPWKPRVGERKNDFESIWLIDQVAHKANGKADFLGI